MSLDGRKGAAVGSKGRFFNGLTRTRGWSRAFRACAIHRFDSGRGTACRSIRARNGFANQASGQEFAAKQRQTKKPVAAAGDAGPNIQNDSGRLEGDIVVTGLRENVKTARSAKRRAQQIVDVVLAQDIGKLPDKNVPEALARVPGVQIDRDRGEGGTLKIRGLSGVMTTVNGSPTFSAGDRTTYLNDISSDLVAGIEVFKTRTPDQVEGSQTGVVNLTLRRPTDFKLGATYALSVRGDYADRVKKVNPYLSALVAYNADTGIGKIGFSVNGTYNDVRYNESLTYNAQPRLADRGEQIILPSTTPANIYLPFQVGFSGPNGWSKRAAVSISTQWRPDSRWTVTLEGGLADQKMLWADTQFDIPVTYSSSAAPPPVLSNIVLGEDGRLVKSVTLTSLDPFGPGRQSYKHNTRNKNARFQVEYNDDRMEFNGWFNYNQSKNRSNNIFHWLRFNQQPSVDIIFNDTSSQLGGGATVNFKNIDLMDKANYVYLDGFDQRREYTYSTETEIKADLKLYTSAHLIDWFKFGYRRANRTYDRNIGGRGYNNLRLPIASLTNYTLADAGLNLSGAAGSPNWLIGDSSSIRNSFAQLRSLLVSTYPELATPYPKYDPRSFFTGSDGSWAAYGMFHYNLKLLFPIEGTVGARIVNSITAISANQTTGSFKLVDGSYQFVETTEQITPRGNYLDILPSVNAIYHFTPKLQLRTSWTYDVGRPRAYDINPTLYVNLSNTSQPYASGGNPKLRGVTLNKYDASLEWYFGSTGSASIAVWQWDQDGLIDRQTLPETLPESPNVPTLVNRPYNLGRGRHRGIEGSLTSFFTFLPGILKSFGGTVNGTLNITRQAFPSTGKEGNVTFAYGPYYNVSKYTYNLIGFYERAGLNARVAYNWRSRQQLRSDTSNYYNNIFLDPVSRLDASINYDIKKYFTIAVEGSNLLRNGNRSYWGTYAAPLDTRYFSRNFSVSLRSRF